MTSCSQSDKKGRLRQEEEQHKTAVLQKNVGGAGCGWEQRRVKWVEMSVRAAGVNERFEDGGESCCEGWLETVEPEVAVFTFMTRCRTNT